MFEISVEESFAAGHALRGYKGKCENPHGHNYKVRITLAGEELDKVGMLWDFKDLKSEMAQIIDRFDHQYLNDLDAFRELNPSAENLARYFYQHTAEKLRQITQGRVRVKDVRVWETDVTTATYFE
jgi:6-pyruvoyltetrahydropterin/6-carboxytetrahydropterin synthase